MTVPLKKGTSRQNVCTLNDLVEFVSNFEITNFFMFFLFLLSFLWVILSEILSVVFPHKAYLVNLYANKVIIQLKKQSSEPLAIAFVANMSASTGASMVKT